MNTFTPSLFRKTRPVSGRLLALLGLVLMMFGCQAKDRSAMVTHRVWDEWAVGQVVDARTGLAVPMQPWLEGLATYLSLIHISEPTRPY